MSVFAPEVVRLRWSPEVLGQAAPILTTGAGAMADREAFVAIGLGRALR